MATARWQALARRVCAGTGCGSCKKLVKGLIEAVAGEVKADPSESWYVPAIPMDKPTLTEEIRKRELKSPSAVLRELGKGEDEKSKMGLASLLKSLWNNEYIDERDSRFINDRVHANIQKDGTFSVVPRMYGGVTSADDLIRFGEVAKKYNVPMVKLTGGQRIDLLGVKKEDLPKIWKDLNMPSGYAYTKAFRTCKTCVGSEFCRFGTNDSTALGIAIERRFQGLEMPAKLKMAVSGCPRNCGIHRERYRPDRHRRGRLGDRGRRGSRRVGSQGRCSMSGQNTAGSPVGGRPVHAVLPGKRQVA